MHFLINKKLNIFVIKTKIKTLISIKRSLLNFYQKYIYFIINYLIFTLKLYKYVFYHSFLNIFKYFIFNCIIRKNNDKKLNKK